jgi:DNA-binding transcriptional LysR family regulator
VTVSLVDAPLLFLFQIIFGKGIYNFMLYLTLRHYEYVVAIGHEGGLSAAANQLNVSQPALSVALNRIEAHLGYALFVRRRGANMTLTPQGRSFVARADALLAQAAQLEDPNHPHPAATTLTLGCFVDLAPVLLAPALSALRNALPQVTITYRTDGFEALIAGLLKGHVDLALTYDLGMDAGFDRHTLFHAKPNALVAPDHPLTVIPGIELSDLAKFPLILSEEGLSAQHILGLFRQRDLFPTVAHRAASLEIMRSLAAHGEGVGISYSGPSSDSSYDGSPLVRLPIVTAETREPVVLARHGTGPENPTMTKARKTISAALRR